MPRKRLPWFKVWVGATRHEKVAMLDDKTFRAWVELLDAASQQTVRGRFASSAAAASVIRRPLASVRILIQAHLIDQAQDGSITLHDWPDWQRWQPDEDHPDDPDVPPESRGNNSGITAETLGNSNGIPHEILANDAPIPTRGAERAKTEKGDGEEDVDERRKTKDETPSATTSPSPKGATAARFSDDEQSRINAISETLVAFGISQEPKVWRKVLDDYGALDLEAEAFKQADWMRRHRIKACTTSRYLNWLAKAREDRDARIAATNGHEPAVLSGCPGCGKANWDVTMGPLCPRCTNRVAADQSTRPRPSSQEAA